MRPGGENCSYDLLDASNSKRLRISRALNIITCAYHPGPRLSTDIATTVVEVAESLPLPSFWVKVNSPLLSGKSSKSARWAESLLLLKVGQRTAFVSVADGHTLDHQCRIRCTMSLIRRRRFGCENVTAGG